MAYANKDHAGSDDVSTLAQYRETRALYLIYVVGYHSRDVS